MHWQCAKKYAADAETQMELALAMETVRWLVCVVCLAALRPPPLALSATLLLLSMKLWHSTRSAGRARWAWPLWRAGTLQWALVKINQARQ